jgi:hypothetical protein
MEHLTMKRSRVILLVALAFVLGAIGGGVATVFLAPRSHLAVAPPSGIGEENLLNKQVSIALSAALEERVKEMEANR